MMVYHQLEERLQRAVTAVLPDASVTEVQVRPCLDAKFGDYQCNSLMSLAREDQEFRRDA